MRNRIRVLLLACFLICLGVGDVFSEYKFPPPEFETDYVIPGMEKPAASAGELAYLDIFILAIVILLSAWASLKRRSRNIIVMISLFSLAYFGFYREGCVCPIGSIQDVSAAFFNPGYYIPVSVIIIFALPLISALFLGRAYCGGACPQGALQDLLLIKEIRLPVWLDRSLSVIAYLYLGAAVLFAVNDTVFLICKYDPFVSFFRMTGPFYMFIAGGVFVLLSTVLGRPYCRFFCPYSAILKPLAVVSKYKVTITPDKCVVCNLCGESCPFGAINKPENLPKSGSNPGLYPVLFIAVIIFGAGLGYFAGGYFSGYNQDVRLALEIHAFDKTLIKEKELSVDAVEYMKKGEGRETLYKRAEEVKRKFQLGGIFFGSFILIVILMQVVYSTRRPKREIYEPDSARCLSCGRCFRDCPVHREDLKKKKEDEQKNIE
ncbi:MAG: 4Fe-4S binding protein [Candidatus Firestonebacteria bacterium]